MTTAADDRRVLAISGPDRMSFLQGLVTNDLRGLDRGAVYAAILTPQGKYLADFFLVPKGETILLDVRSTLAEGLLRRHLAGRDVVIDSAALMDWNVGRGPDPRSVAVAAAHGIDIAAQVARQVRESDFDAFDLILAMDAENVAGLAALAPAGARARILRLGDLLEPGISQDIQDPYEHGAKAFARVFDQLDRAVQAIARNFIPQPNKE